MRLRVFIAVASLAVPTAAAAQQFDVTVGGSYSSGRYGALQRTELEVAYVNLGSTYAGWRVDMTFPYLELQSGGEPVDIGGITLPGGQKARGFGDVVVRASRPLTFLSPLDLTVGAQVKVPTGKAALSTGKFDGRFDVELAHDVGAFGPFVDAAYNSYGDSALLELEDGWSLSAGSTLTLGTTTLIGSYDWSQSSVGGADAHELTGLAAGKLAPRWTWSVSASKGLSSGAADFLFGAGLTRSFGGTGTPPVRRPRRT